MKRPIVLVITHLLVLAAGYGLHFLASSPTRNDVAVMEKAELPPERERPVPTAEDRSYAQSDYRRAWNSLPDSDLPSAELELLRDRMLQEWFAADPRGALMAWAEIAGPYDQLPFSGLSEHALDVVGWVVAGDFGLKGSQILDAITRSLSSMPTERALALIALVPPEKQGKMLEWALHPNAIQAMADPSMSLKSQNDGRLAAIRRLEDERLKSLAWRCLAKGLATSNNEEFHQLLESDDLAAPVRNEILADYGQLLVNAPSGTPEMKEFLNLTAADQTLVAPALLSEAEKLSFARPSAVPDALELLINTDQWELVSSRGAAAIEKHVKSAKPNPEALSRWALRLPERDELAPVFQAAIVPQLRAEPAATRGWIEAFPDGWHREQALEIIQEP